MALVSFKDAKDAPDFGPLPLGKYPCVLRVTNIATDQSGAPMTDGDGKPKILTTQAGDESWRVEAHVVNGPHATKRVFDNFSFGEKAVKRVQILFIRAGIAEEGGADYDCKPEEIDGTFWWVEVSKHEVQAKGGVVAEGKYEFKAGDCKCETCSAYNGKKVKVNAKVDFAGYHPMTPTEAKKYRAEWEGRKAKHVAKAEAEVEESGEVPF